MLDNILSSLVVLLYLSLAVMFAHRLISKSDSPPKKTLLAIGLVTVGVHTYLVIGNLYTAAGLDLSIFTVSSLVALVVTAMLLSAAWREPIESLAILVLPIAALAVLLRTTSEQTYQLTRALPFGLEMHIVFSIVAYSLLSLAALQSIFLYIHDTHLRNKHPGGFVRALPPLQTMERLLFRLIGVGFVILSVSLVSGIFYIEDILGQHLVHKTVLSAGAWLLFAVLLLGRRIFGWRGRIAIRWTLTGFALLLLAYFGSKFVIELVLQR